MVVGRNNEAFLIFKTPQKDRTNEPSLTSLNKDLLQYLSSYLSPVDLISFSRTSLGFYHFTRSQLNRKLRLLSGLLLNNIMHSNNKPTHELRALLYSIRLHIPDSVCLITMQASGEESAGRVWHSISPLQYAAWTGKLAIVELLLECVPHNYKLQALDQLENIILNGHEHGMPSYVDVEFSLATDYQKGIELARRRAKEGFFALTKMMLNASCLERMNGIISNLKKEIIELSKKNSTIDHQLTCRRLKELRG